MFLAKLNAPMQLLFIRSMIFPSLVACSMSWAGQNVPDNPALGAAQLREEITALARSIESTRQARDETEEALAQSEREIVALEQQRRALERQIEDLEQRVAVLDGAVADAQDRLPVLREELDEALRLRYRLARTSRASILFDQEDPAKAQRMLTYFNYLLEAQTGRIDTLSAELDVIVGQREELAAKRESLERARLEHADNIEASQDSRALRNEQLVAIRERLTRDTEAMAAKREEQSRLERLVEGIELLRRREVAPLPAPFAPEPPIADTPLPEPSPPPASETPLAVPPPEPVAPMLNGLAHLKGDLSLPVAGNVGTRFHQPDALSGVPSSGIVIETGEGTDVRSVSAGQVVYSDWFRGYGLLLVIDHGEGFMSLYGYNSELLYPIGATIAADVPIARAGSTGGRSRAGVYFEIRHAGNAVDPLQWCRPRTG